MMAARMSSVLERDWSMECSKDAERGRPLDNHSASREEAVTEMRWAFEKAARSERTMGTVMGASWDARSGDRSASTSDETKESD